MSFDIAATEKLAIFVEDMRRGGVDMLRRGQPVDQLRPLGAAQHQVGQLLPAVPGHEHPGRVVDPDLLDRRVIEKGLQRTEAGDPGDQLSDQRADVGHGCDHTGQAALVVLANAPLRDPAHQCGITLRVDRLAAHQLAHPLVEHLDELLVRAGDATYGWLGQ